VTSSAADVAPALSALRLVSFVPHARDAVHVGLLSPDAQHVIDLAGLGITDALEAIEQLDMLRRAAGAILHGAARHAFAVSAVHLVAPIPLARSVVQDSPNSAPRFADPSTLHGPGGHVSRDDAWRARVGMAAIVGTTIEARARIEDAALDAALIGSMLVLGWPQDGPGGERMLLPGAVGPFAAVPRRRPESLMLTRVAPLSATPPADEKEALSAPDGAQFVAVARAALRSHTLRSGDLITIFPANVVPTDRPPVTGGSWVRVSAPGLGTLSLAVR
jgi:hypothetical protein